MATQSLLFVGTIAASNSCNELSILKGFIAVQDGRIVKTGSVQEYEILKKAGDFKNFIECQFTKDQLLIPGFVDCHTHAPQFPNIGLGLDRPLLEWLDKYTFPLESQYGDLKFAANVYSNVVHSLLKNGTTTACYFGSIHLEGTLELAKNVHRLGQRALVGKVSMNIKNDAGYYNETNKELTEVQSYIEKILELQNDLVLPIITPRFAVSCDEELLKGLSKIAQKYGCRIQSHISENLKEIELVLQLHSDCKSYGDIYDQCGIMNNQCIMAHAIYLTDEEIETFAKKRVSIAHCPASNTRLASGLCPVNKYLRRGIDVGLGTDVSGGDSASILDAMRRAMDVSTHLDLQGSKDAAINWKQAFYLATLGGAKALSLDHKIGNFEVGKDFDALLVDVYAEGGPINKYPSYNNLSKEEYDTDLLQRFLYLGDDRNIKQVFVKGNKVKDIL